MPETEVGKVFSYYSKIGVAALKLENELKAGDTIRVKGATTDFTQKVESIQIENAPVNVAKAGDSIGIKVKDKVRSGDVIYKVTQ